MRKRNLHRRIKKILIIEDDPLIAQDLKALLQEHDFQVVGVGHNARHGLDLVHKHQPDLVMLDIYLGVGDSGIDVARSMTVNHPDIPFVFLSSHDDELTLEEAYAHGPAGYIVKPFQDRTLLTTVKLALQKTVTLTESNPDQLSKSALESKLQQSFSDQEHQVLVGLLAGKSYKEIAAEIHLSSHAIKYHAGKIYRKLDIDSRGELAALLI